MRHNIAFTPRWRSHTIQSPLAIMNAKKPFTIANYGISANSIAGKQLNGPITIFPFTIARFIIASCNCSSRSSVLYPARLCTFLHRLSDSCAENQSSQISLNRQSPAQTVHLAKGAVVNGAKALDTSRVGHGTRPYSVCPSKNVNSMERVHLHVVIPCPKKTKTISDMFHRIMLPSL